MSGDAPTADAARRRLRLRWAAVATAGSLAVAAGSFGLADWWTRSHGWRWLLVAAPVLAFQLWLLWRSLDRNRRIHGGPLLGSLGVPTGLTLARGVLLAALAGFLLLPHPTGPGAWLPAGLYGTAVALDHLDGGLARLTGRTTLLGARLDMAFDAVGLLVAPALGIRYGALPVHYLVVGLARPAYVAAVWAHRHRRGPVGDLPGSRWRRPLAALQMVVCAVALAPVTGPPATTVLATVALMPFLARFLRDYRAVTG